MHLLEQGYSLMKCLVVNILLLSARVELLWNPTWSTAQLLSDRKISQLLSRYETVNIYYRNQFESASVLRMSISQSSSVNKKECKISRGRLLLRSSAAQVTLSLTSFHEAVSKKVSAPPCANTHSTRHRTPTPPGSATAGRQSTAPANRRGAPLLCFFSLVCSVFEKTSRLLSICRRIVLSINTAVASKI